MEEFNRETAKLHFSHPHPLKLIVYNQTLNLTSPCSACKLKPSAGGMLYSCIVCPHYFLHKSCFEAPLSRWSIPTPSRVDNSAVEVVQQMIINNSKAIAQAVLSGGGSGDYNSGFHQLIQLISVINNNSSTSSSAAGGPQYSLQTTVSGGGGGGSGGGGGGSGGGGVSLPEKLTHPIDKRHALTLLAEPAYGEGQFRCDACRESGNGYSYHCRICGIDLHVSCAMLPLSVTRISHVHTLHLVFESPYTNNKFPCDICMKPGSRQWLYRCKPCGFNAHLKCGAPGAMNGGFPGGVPTQITNTNNQANTDVAQGLIGLVSGNGINILSGLLGG